MACNTIKFVGFVFLLSISSPLGAQLEAEKLSLAERLEQTSVLSIFTAVLKQSEVWTVVQNSKSLTLFVPADFALKNENSAFLLQTVLVAPDNEGRLTNSLSYHIVPGVSYTFGTMESSQQLTTLSGECLPVTTAGSDLKVGPEASVVIRIRGTNGVMSQENVGAKGLVVSTQSLVVPSISKAQMATGQLLVPIHCGVLLASLILC